MQPSADATAKPFNICDRTNRYEPCPVCGIEYYMGLSTITSSSNPRLAVRCGSCGHEGPGISLSAENRAKHQLWELDKQAFDAWNNESIAAQASNKDEL